MRAPAFLPETQRALEVVPKITVVEPLLDIDPDTLSKFTGGIVYDYDGCVAPFGELPTPDALEKLHEIKEVAIKSGGNLIVVSNSTIPQDLKGIQHHNRPTGLKGWAKSYELIFERG